MKNISDKMIWEYTDGTLDASAKKLLEQHADEEISDRIAAISQFDAAIKNNLPASEIDSYRAATMKKMLLQSWRAMNAPVVKRKPDPLIMTIGFVCGAIVSAITVFLLGSAFTLNDTVDITGFSMYYLCIPLIVMVLVFIYHYARYRNAMLS